MSTRMPGRTRRTCGVWMPTVLFCLDYDCVTERSFASCRERRDGDGVRRERLESSDNDGGPPCVGSATQIVSRNNRLDGRRQWDRVVGGGVEPGRGNDNTVAGHPSRHGGRWLPAHDQRRRVDRPPGDGPRSAARHSTAAAASSCRTEDQR